jgi:hypothetical protein
MIVDCDRETESFAPPPKKNRPGRPRKYAEGTKPPRKDEDPERKRRNRFKRRNHEEYQRILEEINYVRRVYLFNNTKNDFRRD